MAVYGVSVVRVSENLKSFRMLEALRQSTLKLFTEQNRMSSGYQLLAPSENPGGAATVVRMNQLLEQQDQILKNLKAADGFLSETDQSISDLNSLLIEASSLASEHSGSLTDQEQKNSAAVVIRSMMDQLVALGNRTYQGRYLFGGQQTMAAPFVMDNGAVRYAGDTNNLTTRVDRDEEQAYSITGDRLLGAVSSEVQGYKDWGVMVASDTRIADCGGVTGNGISKGSVNITEVGLTSFSVDLSTADTIGDAVDMINQAAGTAGSSVTASINAAGNGIRLISGGPQIVVEEVTNGTTARDLGILTNGAVPVVAGEDIQPRLTELTRLEDLGNVNLANLASGFVIQMGSESVTVDTSVLNGTNTVQDLLNLISRREMGVLARINDAGTGIDVLSRVSGQPMGIGENGGTTAAELGIRSMQGGTTLADLNSGKGVTGLAGQSDFRVVARNGASFEVSIRDASGSYDHNGDGSETVQDVIDAINDAATAAGVAVTASLASTGNGIRLVDTTGVNGMLQVERVNASYAIDDLGLTNLRATGAGASVEVVGQDIHRIEPSGVFTALQHLYESLMSGDSQSITEAGGEIDKAMTYVNQILGEVGARSKAMTDRRLRTEEAVVATQKVVSEVRDLDYTQAVTRFQQAQTALQANLMTGSKLVSMSLLDFLG